MPEPARRKNRPLHILAALLGTALLVYLVVRAGSDALVENARTIGWGILLVLGLAGISHVVKTWAWRLTLPGEFKKVSFSRTLGLRLISEAIGQFGFVGQVLGDATRASLLTSELPASGIISSVALDRGLFMVSGLIVTILGVITLVFLPAASHGLKLYAAIFGIVLVALLGLCVWAVQRGWPLLSKTARAAGRVPWLGSWLRSKESVILSAEQQLLQFHRLAPAAFWMSTFLNFVTHALAIAEVYLILLLMGSRVTVVGALMLEALTKLINAAGTVNPGNVGTYEGGNMAIVKLVGLHGTEGLTLGLCRRFRSIFWAVIGGICLLYYSRSRQSSQPTNSLGNESESTVMQTQEIRQAEPHSPFFKRVAVVLASQLTSDRELSDTLLAEVGALPLMLRAILSAKSAGADRIIVAVNPENGARIRQSLGRTGRLPSSIEWVEVPSNIALVCALLGDVAANADRVMLIRGDRSYHPSLYRNICEWDGDARAFELSSGGEPIGLIALSRELAIDIAMYSGSEVRTLDDLHAWVSTHQPGNTDPAMVESNAVTDDMWQPVATEEDRLAAERKLESWLVKPTDGVFARMNRRISIPISRQLIKFPITPNMVSLFTLGVSFLSGLYFAFGGYWNMLLGAVLSVWASILDGCDGEVARLKLQTSDFGCWLDTICDYLYYLFIFAGMTIGSARSTGKTSFLAWGGALFFGAIVTFIIAGLGRKRLSGERPEQYLAVWHKKAESRLSNPLIYIGRYCEFIIRRCFLPYSLLVLALLNFIPATLRACAIGANVAWIISLRSYLAFSAKHSEAKPVSVSKPPAADALTA